MSNRSFYKEVKDHVTTAQAAEFYGYKVDRNGMMACPFHPDRTPSMKVDENFICFSCGEKGDVITFVSKVFGLNTYEAARKIVKDMALPVQIDSSSERKTPTAPVSKPKVTDRELFNKAVNRVNDVYCQLFRCLNRWLLENKDMTLDPELRPFYIGIMDLRDRVETLLDVLLYGDAEQKARIIIEKGSEVNSLEQRIKQLESGNRTGTPDSISADSAQESDTDQ